MPPTQTYHVVAEPSADPRPGVLVHSLAGFMDAGGVGRLCIGALLDQLEHRTLATFDLDLLYDYRARRPRMTFVRDHYEDVDLPELLLSEVRDLAGVPFLVLHGPEPDLGWQRFVTGVTELVAWSGVRLTVGLHGIPWPAPHTRPVGLTAHATDPELVAGRTAEVGALEIPGAAAALLELSLGRSGHAAMGFAAHVPHYLVQMDYPRAALVSLEALAAQTGLVLPLDVLRTAADDTDREIADQVAAQPENLEAVRMLEMQYDTAADGSGLPIIGEATDEQLPSADEIGAQIERFLADMDPRGRDEG